VAAFDLLSRDFLENEFGPVCWNSQELSGQHSVIFENLPFKKYRICFIDNFFFLLCFVHVGK